MTNNKSFIEQELDKVNKEFVNKWLWDKAQILLVLQKARKELRKKSYACKCNNTKNSWTRSVDWKDVEQLLEKCH